MAQTTYFSRHK